MAALVLFGGGGDLAMRKLLPAMYARDVANDLPQSARIICVGRHDWSNDDFLAERCGLRGPDTRRYGGSGSGRAGG